ncbi:MAG: ParA family protein [Alphaproteobacteria bacterium]|jgi:chromosome partitioning protein|nr:ParA family protein [Alphaproteobacteria bacterium]
MRILAIANQKGGVGKTTTAINLGTALAAVGKRVLIFDTDPQGNASTGVNIGRDLRAVSSYHVLNGEASLTLAVQRTEIPNLFIIPGEANLAGLEQELIAHVRSQFKLRDAIAAHTEIGGVFDYMLIDCPPSLNILTVNALTAADAVIVPLQCEFFALEGINQLHQTIEAVRANLNRDLTIQGIVLTMYDARTNLSEQVAADVRNFFGDKVYETIIPRNVTLSEAPSHGKPAMIYDHRAAGSLAYMALAKELIERERLVQAA